MNRLIITLLLFINSVWAFTTQSWIESAHQLIHESETEKASARKKLESEENLSTKISESLEKDEYTEEALLVSRILKLHHLFPNILKYADKHPGSYSITTLLAMKDDDSEKKLSPFIKDLIIKRWEKLDALSKVASLNAALDLEITLPAEKLKLLLSEKSDQVRILSTRISGKLYSRTNDSAYADILKYALSSSPYQLRMEALYAIQDFSEQELKLNFHRELQNCLQDKNSNVQKLCSTFKVSAKK